ncbi:MAG: tRNA (guanine37-N1)-methyltransferase [Candidatus Berkelbacteria bacterium Licking1014_7]|uniref:tRNA (guanine-N(1)-)-methyltransferase n=1 Tax=Candidatus Berkelbacteria bacterium Licking1014_7 TaxID=2017147 RepID=A0A554LKT2_9BACT|nr:MAG: tRNA (guanine37-N1)-methyltransferase [Candidatus Berkelbacteria bacterium Licking1014_7]
MKQFIILTLFPEIFASFLKTSLIQRAQKKDIINIELVNLRDFGIGKHKQVDDKPYGGGPGMIIKINVLEKAIEDIKFNNPNTYIILLDPKGKTFNQNQAKILSQKNKTIVLVCGRYEGFDSRIDNFIDEKISIGDFILSGGEVAAMAIIEATSRLLPNFLGSEKSLENETFSNLKKEYPQFTKPENYKGLKVPSVLLSGDHKKIKKWQENHSR